MREESYPAIPLAEQDRRMAVLIARFLCRTISRKDHNELDEWVGSSDENIALFEELTDPDVVAELFGEKIRQLRASGK